MNPRREPSERRPYRLERQHVFPRRTARTDPVRRLAGPPQAGTLSSRTRPPRGERPNAPALEGSGAFCTFVDALAEQISAHAGASIVERGQAQVHAIRTRRARLECTVIALPREALAGASVLAN
jgi:hypothetical protein